MAKFVRVTSAPSTLDKGSFIIDAPNFKTEIELSSKKRPKNGLMTGNYLREIFAAIGDKYGNEHFNALTAVNVSKYKGVPCETTEQIERVVLTELQKSCPFFIDAYMDYHIKKRPSATKLIYFLGNFNQTDMFIRNGIDEVKEKDVDVYLGKKKKKIIGKPAITNEAAALNRNS